MTRNLIEFGNVLSTLSFIIIKPSKIINEIFESDIRKMKNRYFERNEVLV